MPENQPNVLRILTYHRVANARDSYMLDPRLISTDPATFKQHMQHLANHYHVVSLEDVCEAIARGTQLPKKSVLITFDDAYCDLAKHALSILQALRLPATIFVPTAYPDQPERAFWWDRMYRTLAYTAYIGFDFAPIGHLSLKTPAERRQSIRKIKRYLLTMDHNQAMLQVDQICEQLHSQATSQKSVLTWDELRGLSKQRVTLGAHTRTHPILTNLSAEQARDEMLGSQQDLQREIGHVLPVFCYPNGNHNATTTQILKENGFVAAFTTLVGHNNLQLADPLRLNRQNITPKTSLTIFRLRLLRLGAYVDQWRLRNKQQAY
ncbi:MAG: polysaccharide deacetylase family protein [Chloroflexi bacterium]|nr:polysaccharide deacetylase family protein [Chloroflexota bacterium]